MVQTRLFPWRELLQASQNHHRRAQQRVGGPHINAHRPMPGRAFIGNGDRDHRRPSVMNAVDRRHTKNIPDVRRNHQPAELKTARRRTLDSRRFERPAPMEKNSRPRRAAEGHILQRDRATTLAGSPKTFPDFGRSPRFSTVLRGSWQFSPLRRHEANEAARRQASLKQTVRADIFQIFNRYPCVTRQSQAPR